MLLVLFWFRKYYQEETNATYLGTFSLEEFIAITDNTEIIVTPVSMMMHIALALKKQMMLFHNIFMFVATCVVQKANSRYFSYIWKFNW